MIFRSGFGERVYPLVVFVDEAFVIEEIRISLIIFVVFCQLHRGVAIAFNIIAFFSQNAGQQHFGLPVSINESLKFRGIGEKLSVLLICHYVRLIQLLVPVGGRVDQVVVMADADLFIGIADNIQLRSQVRHCGVCILNIILIPLGAFAIRGFNEVELFIANLGKIHAGTQFQARGVI